MTPETDLDDQCLWSSKYSSMIALEERVLKDVETTIKPLVEMAHKMTDLKLTVQESLQHITTRVSIYLCWSTKNDLERFGVGIKSDLKWIEQRCNHLYSSSFLRYVLIALASDRTGHILLRGERVLERYKDEIWDGVLPHEHSQEDISVAVAAVLHLLAFVFQYLIGYTDRGGSKTYSSGCLDFRESFISLLLFHGAYVWIKFRQPATGKRKATGTQSGDDRSKVYARASRNGSATKYEARYNIPTDRLDEDHPVRCPRLSLGLYKSDVEALFVSRVARSFYEVQQPGEACCVEIQPGVHHEFSVPAMSEQEQELVGEEKRQWVISKAKQVGKQKYAEFRMEQSAMATDTESTDPSPSRSSSLAYQPSADEPLDAPSHLRGPYEESGLQLRSLEYRASLEQQWLWESPPVVSTLTESEDFEAMWAVLDLYPAPQPESTTLDRNIPYSGSARIDSIIESVPQPESVLAQELSPRPQVPEPQQVHRPLQAQSEVFKENESTVHQRYEGLLKDYERLREENELLKSVIVTLVAGKRK